ncbi:distal membrane-arm assembly complex protein 2-like [Diadema antillarum]|uniref:distal membrane-arm assembly complex protein 2-like n=1 Tax=Diadema antillarum TaxID=105358 RepID=UPI003A8B98B3
MVDRRCMSLWYFAKKKIQHAWATQVKSETGIMVQKYGVEIGTAHSLARMGARVQFSDGQWYTRGDVVQNSLPVAKLEGQFVLAIDAKETLVDQFAMVDIVKLTRLKFLSLEGCPLVDDHCLASLVHLRDSLTHLNINKCPEITENGVAVLHKLRHLERLNMNDMPKVNHAPLVAVMLEDVLPQLRISLVSRHVERFKEDEEKSKEIIRKHRIQAGLVDEEAAEKGVGVPKGGNDYPGQATYAEQTSSCKTNHISSKSSSSRR